MAHSHVALDVERRRAGEAERLHVGKHLCLEHARLRPRATETGDQLVVHRAAAIATVSYHEPCINPKFSYDFGEFRRIRISVLDENLAILRPKLILAFSSFGWLSEHRGVTPPPVLMIFGVNVVFLVKIL